VPQDVEISLREVTAETVRAVCKLDVRPAQRGYVAPNSFSIAQAYFEPRAWFRAVYANETPVGFVMLELDRERQSYFLWRFMIGAAHQGRGYGRRALDLVVEHVRTLPGARELRSSYLPGHGSPRGFYLRYGFGETEERDGREVVIRLHLQDGPED
jgi:diamine N-acetyltransferase